MHIRNGFVSNSSTSSFILKNLSDEPKSLKDYISESMEHLIAESNRWGNKINDYIVLEIIFKPKQQAIIEFCSDDTQVRCVMDGIYDESVFRKDIIEFDIDYCLNHTLRYCAKSSKSFSIETCDFDIID